MKLRKVVIVGAGFGGLLAAQGLRGTELDVTVIDKTNHHVFQPLLYQVATAALSPADIAVPIRSVFRDDANIKVLLDEVISVDRQNRKVHLKNESIDFDYLILAPGSKHSYFGNDQWEKFAPGLKTLSDALTIRENIITALEKAEKEQDPEIKKAFLTFVIIGGGPTGVELAGAIAEIAKKTIIKDYKSFSYRDTKIVLLEGADRLLLSFDEALSKRAAADLKNMGVNVLLNTFVTEISEEGVRAKDNFIKTKNIIWAAGNKSSPLLQSLNVELDRAGRVPVDFDCALKEDENIFVIGDSAKFIDEKHGLLAGIAPVAMQQGRYVAKIISNQIDKENRKPFHYIDKGTMATIGKAKAVCEIHGLKFTGFIAWFLWSFIHILYLIGFRNRFRVMLEWMWYYVTNRHGTRLIVGK